MVPKSFAGRRDARLEDSMEAIKTVGLTKTYGAKRAVDALNLTVQRGEIYGFMGRNGAGKSTAMKMMAGLVLPTSGTIEFGRAAGSGCYEPPHGGP